MAATPQDTGPMSHEGADAVRENLKKTAGAESGARTVTDRLKAQGDAAAKKHGG